MGTSEHKVVLRDHDHTVECIAWAPESALASVCEAAGADVSDELLLSVTHSLIS